MQAAPDLKEPPKADTYNNPEIGSFGVPENPLPMLPFLYDPWATGLDGVDLAGFEFAHAVGLFVSTACRRRSDAEKDAALSDPIEVGWVEYPEGAHPRVAAVLYMGNEYGYTPGTGLSHGCFQNQSVVKEKDLAARGRYSPIAPLAESLRPQFPAEINKILGRLSTQTYGNEYEFVTDFVTQLIGKEWTCPFSTTTLPSAPAPEESHGFLKWLRNSWRRFW